MGIVRIVGDVASASGDWSTTGLFVLAVLGAAIGTHRWLKHHVVEPLKAVGPLQRDVAAIKRQVYRNGGKSLADAVVAGAQAAGAEVPDDAATEEE